MARLILIRGLPGSGKTTLAKALLRAGEADEHFEADMFFEKDGIYTYDPDNIARAHKWCYDQTKYMLGCGHRVIVSNTFSREFEAATYFSLLENRSELQILMCFGNWPNVHGVPDEKILQMRQRWEWF